MPPAAKHRQRAGALDAVGRATKRAGQAVWRGTKRAGQAAWRGAKGVAVTTKRAAGNARGRIMGNGGGNKKPKKLPVRRGPGAASTAVRLLAHPAFHHLPLTRQLALGRPRAPTGRSSGAGSRNSGSGRASARRSASASRRATRRSGR